MEASPSLYRTHSSRFRRNTWDDTPTPYGTISGNDNEMVKILVMAEALENGMKYMDRLHNFY